MLCENCHSHQATIQLNLQINGHKRQMHLCDTCYQEIKKKWKTPSFHNGESPFNNMFNGSGSENGQVNPTEQQNASGLLDQYARNITDAARMGLIDPVIGRDKEIDRVIEILNRRNKNNPVLIGEPGVGKTAIAEGLALKITEGNVPAKLQNKVVYLLDVASLVSNTGIRGQFEERMKQLMTELKEKKNAILFIDEVHQLVGAGSAEGSMDAGNILKPALARGELQLIGATTLKEYRQIEKDAALERRFQPVMVDEPGIEEAIAILNGLKARYEEFHQVKYSEDALRACVTLSDRYIQDRFLPDKAIDLMDEAGSKLNLAFVKPDKPQLENQLAQIRKEKEEATHQEAYEKAAQLRDQEFRLMEQLDQAEDEKESASQIVNLEAIQSLVETKTGIPIKKLERDEQNKMKYLADHLNKKVIGQEEAINRVAKAIRRNRAGLKRNARPIGSFLFAGSTGVGKTELAKSLAEEIFGDREAMIRLDMSEYMEKHTVSKLIGSPPGYVGHEEAGQLTEKVRRKPYSLILLDEIEKAHPDVQNMFLQILEDGRLTDSQGRTVSFKDTVIIATTNAGVGITTTKVGFGQKEENQEPDHVLGSLIDYFRPEFLNRFDGVIRFNALEKEDLARIVDLLLDDVIELAKEQGIELNITPEAKTKLAELGYNPQFGARPLRRVIEEHVEDAIADKLVDSEDVLSELTVDVENHKIKVK